MYSTNDCAANSFFVHFSRSSSICWIHFPNNSNICFFYNSHFWVKAFLSFLSAYSLVLIFLVSLRIRLSGGSLSSLQLHQYCCSGRYCLLQLSLLSAAAIPTVCCSYRYCLLQLSLLCAAAIATVCSAADTVRCSCATCFSCGYIYTYRRLLELHYALELLLLLLSQSPWSYSCLYFMLQMSLQRMHLSVAASAGPLKNLPHFIILWYHLMLHFCNC